MIRRIMLPGIIMIIISLIGCIEETDVEFGTIAMGYYCGHNESGNYMINDENDWANLWDIVYSTTTPQPPLPEIDFTQYMVIAVFMGIKPTGGYSIEIIKIVEINTIFEIHIEEKSPDPDSIVTDALTQPFHIIKTKIIEKEIVFKKDN